MEGEGREPNDKQKMSDISSETRGSLWLVMDTWRGNTDKWKKLKKRDCEFCFLVIVGWNMTIPRPDPMNAIEPTDLGNFQVTNIQL